MHSAFREWPVAGGKWREKKKRKSGGDAEEFGPPGGEREVGRSGQEVGQASSPHTPVLLNEVLEWLRIRPDGIYVDATTGAGGHSAAIAARLSSGRGRLI